jgi:hypothetical protein
MNLSAYPSDTKNHSLRTLLQIRSSSVALNSRSSLIRRNTASEMLKRTGLWLSRSWEDRQFFVYYRIRYVEGIEIR